MHYLIDGYNLLFRILESNESLQTQRNALIEAMARAAKTLKLHATLVFDSQYQPTEGSRHHLGDLEIIYTDRGETADEFILKTIKDAPKPESFTVVTSDKVLANQCRYKLAKTLAADAFLDWVDKRKKNIAAGIKKDKLITPIRKPLPPPVKPKAEKPKDPTQDDYERLFTEKLNDPVQGDNKRLFTEKRKEKKKPKKKETDWERWLKAFGG